MMPTAAAPDASTSHTTTTSPRRRTIALIKAAVCLVVLAFVGWALVKQFRQVRWDEVRFHPGLAALAVLAMLGVNASQLVMFRSLLAAYGYRLPWRVTLGAAWVPPLGKYVPGKVASVAGAVYLLRGRGVSGAVAVSIALMMDGLAVITGLVFSTPLLLWAPVRREMPTAWAWCAALAAAGVVALHPRVFVALLNVLLRKTGRLPLPAAPRAAQYLLPLAAAFAQWLFAGLGLWLMTRSVAPVSGDQIPMFVATAAMAMTLSYLALFAPAGLGVREGLFLLTLGPVVGARAAIVVVAMRVVQTITELVLASVGFAALRAARDGRKEQE
jgi:hypothetical protein